MKSEIIIWGLLTILAGIVSYPSIGIDFVIRAAAIYFAVSQLNDMFVRKKWGATGLIVVDEIENRNSDLKFMKLVLAPLCILVLLACIIWDYI